jgi:hypothetical protein
MKPGKKLRIRNSTAEFLIFTRQAGESGIEVRVEEATVWLTQKLIAALFDVTVPTINEHLTNLYAQGEILEPATLRNFRTVQKEGKREVTRYVDYYIVMPFLLCPLIFVSFVCFVGIRLHRYQGVPSLGVRSARVNHEMDRNRCLSFA